MDDGVYHGVDPLSAPDIAEGRGRIPLSSTCGPASSLVTSLLMSAVRSHSSASATSVSCPDSRRRRKDGLRAPTIEPGRGAFGLDI